MTSDIQPPRRSSPLLRVAILALGASALLTLPARAETAEQREACTPDALKLCSATIPDIAKTTACMKEHVAELSPRCRAAFNDASSSPTKTAAKASKAKMAAREEREPREERRASAERMSRDERKLPKAASMEERRNRRLDAARDSNQRRLAVAEPPMREPRAVVEPDNAYVAVPIQSVPLIGTPIASGSGSQTALLCREGLIDVYTCSHTIPALGLGN